MKGASYVTNLEKTATRWERELGDAWNALPSSVAGDAAPEGTTLAERITALSIERDRYFAQAKQYHERSKELRAKSIQDEADIRHLEKLLASLVRAIEVHLVYTDEVTRSALIEIMCQANECGPDDTEEN